MIVLFWLEEGTPCSLSYENSQLMVALAAAENLRAMRKGGADITHVVIQSEMTESVGEAGVTETGADYNWFKRRPDPSIPVGRPSGKDHA